MTVRAYCPSAPPLPFPARADQRRTLVIVGDRTGDCLAQWFANKGQILQTLFSAVGAGMTGVSLFFLLKTKDALPSIYGIIFAPLGFLIFLFAVLGGAGSLKSGLTALARVLSIDHPTSSSAVPVVEAAHSLDLRDLQNLYAQNFGEEAPSLAQMRLWHSLNDNIFQLVVEKTPSTGARTIVASFKAIPLKTDAIPYLEMGALTGANLDVKYIVKRGGRVSAWYIGDLVSTSRMSAVIVMKALRDYLMERLKEPKPIFARALTEKGLSLLREFQFTPVLGGKMAIGQMCSLLPPDLDDLTARLQSCYPSRKPERRRTRKPNTPPQQ